MAINKPIWLVSCCIAIIVIFNTCTCTKNILGCAETTYSFQANAIAYPDKDSMRIGDTLWLEITVPASIKDSVSGNIINYSGAENLGIAISLLSFHGGSISDPGGWYVLDSFNYALETGSIYSDNQYAINYLFAESNSTYTFKLGIVPRQNGLYALSISDAANVYTKKDKCSKAYYYFKFTQTNQHIYIYQNNRPGYQISDYERTHLYCFKVYQ